MDALYVAMFFEMKTNDMAQRLCTTMEMMNDNNSRINKPIVVPLHLSEQVIHKNKEVMDVLATPNGSSVVAGTFCVSHVTSPHLMSSDCNREP